MEKIKKSESMEEIAKKVIEEHKEDFDWIECEEIKIAYVYSDKEKRQQGCRVFGECRKADPTTKELAQCDFIITFYEPNTRRFSEKQLYILMYHELLHASMKSGNTAITPHDYIVGDFRKIVEKYGADWAEPGKEVEAE